MAKPIDETGNRYGRLTVLKKVQSKHHSTRWLCQCDCSNQVEVDRDKLKSGNTQSCGCYRKQKMKETAEDLIGQKFNYLTVIQRRPNKNLKVRWLCQCYCGNQIETSSNQLKTGRTKSCGCYKDEIQRKRLTTHGLSDSEEYQSYSSMIQRVTNPNNISYPNYGGKGVTICDRWLESFKNFYEDMGPMPGPGYSLERKNNKLGYYKDNCKWILKSEQPRNQTNNHIKDLEEAEFVRDLYNLGHSVQDLANCIGCSENCIYSIINNITWT